MRDLNNDGRSDLIAATWASQNGWHVFLGSTSEGLLAGIQYRFNEFAIGGVTIADFNQDQRQDMVIFGLYGDPPRIYWGDGNGGFRGYTTFRLEPAMFGFAADVNNDGKPDLLTRLGLSTINTRVIINSAL